MFLQLKHTLTTGHVSFVERARQSFGDFREVHKFIVTDLVELLLQQRLKLVQSLDGLVVEHLSYVGNELVQVTRPGKGYQHVVCELSDLEV